MEKKYKWAVYMGRFQPFHEGHLNVVNKALELAENVIILIGGANKSRQVKNPWTVMERMTMIYGSVPYNCSDRIFMEGMHDHPYDIGEWAREVRGIVTKVSKGDDSVALVGHHKDNSSYYLDLFPDWSFEEIGNYNNIDATMIRDIYFGHPYINILATGVPKGTKDMMRVFLDKPEYAALCEEYKYIKKYKSMWDKAPFPPTFITVDISVISNGNILTIMRGGHPGKGTRALPGGYIDVKEAIVDSARRELKEETGIDLDRKNFTTRLLDVKVFDNPERSQLGRVVTHMYTIVLDDLLVEAIAGDDAAGVMWLPINELDKYRHQFSSDHWYMAKHAAKKYRERRRVNSMSHSSLLSGIASIMAVDNRTLEQRVMKTGEEYGEMCEAVCSATGAPGCEYKGKTMDDVVEEAWDTATCAISVALHAKPLMQPNEHADLIREKLLKWKNKVHEGMMIKNDNA